MEKPLKRDVRDGLSRRYADLMGEYQQDHRILMDMLRDDEVLAQAFQEHSERLQRRINELKEIKLELLRQRAHLDVPDEDG